MAFLGCRWAALIVLLFSLTPHSKSTTILPGSQDSRDIKNSHFDYVILGGGTAGLVVASRLSENPRITVAVIEAGDFEQNNPNVTNLSKLGAAKNTRVDWEYISEPQIFADNRRLVWSAGKGVGGSSLINGKYRNSLRKILALMYLRNDLYSPC